MRNMYGGPSGHGRGNGRGPLPPSNGALSDNSGQESKSEEEAKSLRQRFDDWRKQSKATLAAIPRAFGLVWQSHKGFTVSTAILSILFGIIPTAIAWVGKLLIDGVVEAIKQSGGGETTTHVIELVVVQFVLLAISSLLQTVRDINQQALQELTSRRIQLMLMQHANRLDLSFFENPAFYDLLTQAQNQATFRPTQMVQQMFNLLRSLITF
ncbi:MAG: hypothetical protein ABJA50_05745, partial [Chloroflexota bacterium]